ncbi:MAG: exosome complex protein Rrp4 [Candidatus Diapherotrites archaeon]|nr:exosome complex protein Rrp4 [Candidatus Diapherotrites archaeon]
MRKLVIPGELVSDNSKKAGQHVFVRDGKLYSDCIGLVNESYDSISVIPLEGPYIPNINDIVIGIIEQELFAGYVVNINSFYSGFIPKKNIDFFAKVGDLVSVKIASVNEVNEVDLDSPRILEDGELLEISPVKIPRVIGKEGSMLNILKKGTGCNILVGRNGRIWIKGGDVKLAFRLIKFIESQAHTENLTDRVTKIIEEAKNQSSNVLGE